jgi:hypothetical protein
MSLLVLSYPSISEGDLNWIQSVRAIHDLLYFEVVAPHFTMVFPVNDIDSEILLEEVKQRSAEVKLIPFVLRCAIPFKDSLSEQTHVFLVPDEGFGAIVKLHDRLYSGRLANQLRLDVPFIPHFGIGNSIDPWKCKGLADDLNRRPVAIQGTIRALDVVSFEDAKVKTIGRVLLE